MSFRLQTLASRGFVVASLVAFSLFGYGCGGSNNSATLSAQFTASTTPPNTLHLIKLVQKSASGAFVVVQAVIYGPDVTLDMYSFAFDVKIVDASVVQFVTGSAIAGNALQPFVGQTIQAIAGFGTLPGGGVDTSRVVVGVSKLGPVPGNGIAGSSAVVVELTFQVLKQGTTTLTLTGNPNPQVLDSNGVAIGTITFDSASASMTGISTGGGGY